MNGSSAYSHPSPRFCRATVKGRQQKCCPSFLILLYPVPKLMCDKVAQEFARHQPCYSVKIKGEIDRTSSVNMIYLIQVTERQIGILGIVF